MEELIKNDSDVIFDDIDSSKEIRCKRKKSNIIFGSIFTIIIFLIILIIILNNSSKSENKEEDNKHDESEFKILKKNEEFIKPNNVLNMKFELIELKSGLKVFLINDNYTPYSSFYVETSYGYGVDTFNGLAHLSEHLTFAGNSNFENSYKMWDLVYSLYDNNFYAFTHVDKIHYFIAVPNNINFEESINNIHDFFMFPDYDINLIKEEIQSVNSESTQKNNYFEIIGNQIITDLSNENTSFHGYGMGNNQTMDLSNVEKIKRILLGNAIQAYDPKKLIYIIYSKNNITNLEEIAVKILGKNQRKININEYDENDIKQREKNIKDINNGDIYGDKLYLHGLYYNSSNGWNSINIYINIKKFDFKNLKFDPSDYLNYLMFSESLLDILKNKKYIINNNYFQTKTDIFFENNVLLKLSLYITDEALINHLDDLLLIIYKYFKLIKDNAYKEIYFNNFKQKMEIISNNTQKEYFEKGKNQDVFANLIQKYKYFGFEQFLKLGTPETYNENDLKYFANRFSIENTFILIGTQNIISEKNVFEKFEEKKVFGFEKYYNYSKISNEFIEKINSDNSYDNLKFREINNDYFTKINEKVIPCFKEEKNTCEEKNEFDLSKNENYKGKILDENDKKYLVLYQIDKSSETHLVNLYLTLNINPYEKKHPLSSIIYTYISNLYEWKLKEINEIKNTVKIIKINENIFSFRLITYSDICEIIFKKLIDILNQNITQEEFDYMKESYKENLKPQFILNLANEVSLKLFSFFNKGQNITPSFDFSLLELIKFEDITEIQEFSRNISSSKLLVAGNINETLVKNLNDYIKKNYEKNNDITYNDGNTLNKEKINKNKIAINNALNTDNNLSYIYNYYEKLESKGEIDGMIMLAYLYDISNTKLSNYLKYFVQCGKGIFLHELKDKYMDSYGPFIGLQPSFRYINSNFILISIQGRMTEPEVIDDHIQVILKEIFEGKIKCPQFESIKKSILFKDSQNFEKTPNNLFDDFINKNFESNMIKNNNLKNDEFIPNTFEEVVEEVKDIFINPKRVGVYGYRRDIKEEDMNKRMNEKKLNNKYFLNNNLSIEYTNNISYLIDKQLYHKLHLNIMCP